MINWDEYTPDQRTHVLNYAIEAAKEWDEKWKITGLSVEKFIEMKQLQLDQESLKMKDEIERLESINKKMESENAALQAVLKNFEWIFDRGIGDYFCSMCGSSRGSGHGSNCEYVKVNNG